MRNMEYSNHNVIRAKESLDKSLERLSYCLGGVKRLSHHLLSVGDTNQWLRVTHDLSFFVSNVGIECSYIPRMMRNLIELRKSSSDTTFKAEVDILMNETKVKFANLLRLNLINE